VRSLIVSMLGLYALCLQVYVMHLSDVVVMLQHRRQDDVIGGNNTVDVDRRSYSRIVPGGATDNDAAMATASASDEWDDDRNATTRILVVYSGPNDKQSKVAELYERNTDHFLRNGIEYDDCEYDDGDRYRDSSAGGGMGGGDGGGKGGPGRGGGGSRTMTDTVIVVGHEYYNMYLPRIRMLNEERHRLCGSRHWGREGSGRDAIYLVARRNVCYDMESARLALYGGVAGLPHSSTYDYFFLVNCGVTGPPPRPPQASSLSGRRSWTTHFIELLDDTVKMTGLTLNCELENAEHLMSMMYAVDRVGLDVIMKSGAIYDCLLEDGGGNDFVNTYERKMGTSIIEAGYGLRPLMRHRHDFRVTKDNLFDCRPCEAEYFQNKTMEEMQALFPICKDREFYRDVWIGSRYGYLIL
jgi:hypothetical protein